MLDSTYTIQNNLLAALPRDAWKRVSSQLEPVNLSLSDVLYEPGQIQHHVYFPTDSIISLLYVMESGATAEIAAVGNEGLVGVAVFMGGNITASRAVVRGAGRAFRIKAELLKREFDHSAAIQRLLLRYTQALIAQMTQTAACNRHHSIDQQLCRWLLLTLDRLPSNELTITQELIGNLLGVRRAGVTEAARKLQRARLIEYRHGHITVLDRSGLEAKTCECYVAVKKEFTRLLSDAITR